MFERPSPNENKIKPFEIVIIACMCIFIIASIILSVRLLNKNDVGIVVCISLMVVALFFDACLFVFCVATETWNRRQKSLFESLILAFFVNAWAFGLCETALYLHINSRVSLLLYTVTSMFSVVYWTVFWRFQKDKFEHRIDEQNIELTMYGYFVIYFIVLIVNCFNEFSVSISDDGSFIVRFPIIHILTVSWYLINLIFVCTSKCDRKTKPALCSFSIMPIISFGLLAIFADSEFYFDISIGVSSIIYLLPLYLLFFNIYIERDRVLLVQEKEIERSRADIMALQINPHFIANTMSSIVVLCKTDAKKAQDLSSKFARYLRDNYASISMGSLIPVSIELDHVENYLAVEKVRFPNLKVEYDLKCLDFEVPVLTVQTLVENAIRHGIQKTDGAEGTVKISTFETANDYSISIQDNGVGFDSSNIPNDGKHVGISNVTLRLKVFCNGTLHINSKMGKGTECKILIPKSDKERK